MALTKEQLNRGSVGEFAQAKITMLDGAEETVLFRPPAAVIRKRIRDLQDLEDDEKTSGMLDILADHILDDKGKLAFDSGDDIPIGLMEQLSKIVLNVEVTTTDPLPEKGLKLVNTD